MVGTPAVLMLERRPHVRVVAGHHGGVAAPRDVVQLAHRPHGVDRRREEAGQRLLLPMVHRVGGVDRQQHRPGIGQRDLE